MQILRPNRLLTTSVLLGILTVFLPWTKIAAGPSYGECGSASGDLAPGTQIYVFFWVPNPSSMSVDWNSSLVEKAHFDMLQTIGRVIFLAQMLAWAGFFLARMETKRSMFRLALRMGLLLFIAILVVVGLIGSYLSPLPCPQIAIEQVSLIWPTVLLAVVGLGFGVAASMIPGHQKAAGG